jgi:hypothetical protein
MLLGNSCKSTLWTLEWPEGVTPYGHAVEQRGSRIDQCWVSRKDGELTDATIFETWIAVV